jgi:HSP20 family protein
MTMWGFTDDLDRTFSALEDFRRQMARAIESYDARGALYPAGNPRAALRDAGGELVLDADVPGLSEKDLELTVTQESVTLSADRKTEVPEGYAVHRRERPERLQFSRSFALPVKVDTERVTAAVKDGVLTVTLPKAAESKPRQVTVRASS